MTMRPVIPAPNQYLRLRNSTRARRLWALGHGITHRLRPRGDGVPGELGKDPEGRDPRRAESRMSRTPGTHVSSPGLGVPLGRLVGAGHRSVESGSLSASRARVGVGRGCTGAVGVGSLAGSRSRATAASRIVMYSRSRRFSSAGSIRLPLSPNAIVAAETWDCGFLVGGTARREARRAASSPNSFRCSGASSACGSGEASWSGWTSWLSAVMSHRSIRQSDGKPSLRRGQHDGGRGAGPGERRCSPTRGCGGPDRRDDHEAPGQEQGRQQCQRDVSHQASPQPTRACPGQLPGTPLTLARWPAPREQDPV